MYVKDWNSAGTNWNSAGTNEKRRCRQILL